MFKLWRQLKEFLDFVGLDIGEIIAIFKKFADLSAPPDVDNGLALRAWLSNFLAALDAIAAETGPDWDDNVVDVLGAILANDDAWDVAHLLITMLIGDDQVDADIEDVALSHADDIAKAIGPEVGNPAMIFMIIQGVVFVIQQLQRWRDR